MRGVDVPIQEEEPSILLFVVRCLEEKGPEFLWNHLWECLLFDLPRGATDQFKNAFRTHPDCLEEAREQFVKCLRYYVDLWINSGKTRSDDELVDDPTKRNVGVPEKYSPLFWTLDVNLFDQERCKIGMRADGTQGLIWMRPAFPFNEFQMKCDLVKEASDRIGRDVAIGNISHSALASTFRLFGTRLASYYAARLLDSQDSRKICRCDGCDRYFALQRQRLRAVSHGVFCFDKKCRVKAAAKRTIANRDRRKTAKLAVVEAAFKEWKPSRKYGDPREWIVTKVNNARNKADKEDPEISRKWLTQVLREKRPELLVLLEDAARSTSAKNNSRKRGRQLR